MSKYPVHEKVVAIPEEAKNHLSSFLDWLNEQGYRICRYHEGDENSQFVTDGEYLPVRRTSEQLMFDFYGLDLEAFRDEKEALYQEFVRQTRSQGEP